MLYWLDYDFINSTSNQVKDTIPACATIKGFEVGGVQTGQTITWTVPDANSSNAYTSKGSLYVLVQLSGCPTGPNGLCNTGQYQSNSTGGWLDSNQVCQTIGDANVQLTKQQLDSSYAPVASVNSGATVNYVLSYQFSGSGLKCFDDFQSIFQQAGSWSRHRQQQRGLHRPQWRHLVLWAGGQRAITLGAYRTILQPRWRAAPPVQLRRLQYLQWPGLPYPALRVPQR